MMVEEKADINAVYCFGSPSNSGIFGLGSEAGIGAAYVGG